MSNELAKAIELAEKATEQLQKSHVKQYTRQDGTVVKEHEDSRQAATDRANELTKIANNSGDPKDHKAAAEAHRHAAQVSYKGDRMWHRSNAVEHEEKSKLPKSKYLPSRNESHGFHGEASRITYYHANSTGSYQGETPEHRAMHKKMWNEASKHIKAATGAEDEDVRNFLDSSAGRHFADDVHNAAYGRGFRLADPDKDAIPPDVFHDHIKHAVKDIQKKWPKYLAQEMARTKASRASFG